MTWVAILVIGVALGWAAELLLDIWYWGRRNRRLQAQLGDCQSKSLAFQLQLKEARSVVAHYQQKEAEFKKCRVDLADLAGRHKDMEAQREQLTLALHSSQDRIGALDRRALELRAENEELYDTLEDVDHWVESSMRRQIWDTTSLKSGILQTKARSKAYAQSLVLKANEKMRKSVDKINGNLVTAKAEMGQKITHTLPVRWVKNLYCRAWGLIGSVFKKGSVPASCAFTEK